MLHFDGTFDIGQANDEVCKSQLIKEKVVKFPLVALPFLIALIPACQTIPEVGLPSSNFDGRYSFKHHCHDDEELSAKFDGSEFVILGGIISNNRAGAGRYNLEGVAKIDAKGNLAITGKRKTSEFLIYGNLLDRKDKFSIASTKHNFSGELTGYIRHSQTRHPCVAQFKKIGNAPKPTKTSDQIDANDKTTIQISSKNTMTENDLITDKGEKVLVDIELQNLQQISEKGLAIIVPSSTPNMDDEAYYAKK